MLQIVYIFQYTIAVKLLDFDPNKTCNNPKKIISNCLDGILSLVGRKLKLVVYLRHNNKWAIQLLLVEVRAFLYTLSLGLLN